MTTAPTPRSSSRRTRFATRASILAVGLAGAIAVGANIGILNAAGDSNDVGTLSAAGDLVPADPQVIDVYVDSPTSDPVAMEVAREFASPGEGSVAVDPTSIQTFMVDAAGAVSITLTDTGLHLEWVQPTTGWTWSLSQSSPSELSVALTNAPRTIDLVATIGPDGKIAIDVSESTNTQAPSGSAGGSPNPESPNRESHGGESDDGESHEGGGDDD